jgi:hypothetical protein
MQADARIRCKKLMQELDARSRCKKLMQEVDAIGGKAKVCYMSSETRKYMQEVETYRRQEVISGSLGKEIDARS